MAVPPAFGENKSYITKLLITEIILDCILADGILSARKRRHKVER